MQIGIDLGATKIESVLLDDKGSELHRSRKTSPKSYKETIKSISDSVNYIEKEFTKNLKKGASVSVNGVCLTSKNKGSKILKFDVIEETLKRTNLRNVCKNDFVNLERSISASTEIGGHLMSGHVHYAAKILEIVNKKGIKDIKISLNEKYSDYVLEKGYIGINGCSITIGKVNKNSFLVHLIPETLEITNLKKKLEIKK